MRFNWRDTYYNFYSWHGGAGASPSESLDVSRYRKLEKVSWLFMVGQKVGSEMSVSSSTISKVVFSDFKIREAFIR